MSNKSYSIDDILNEANELRSKSAQADDRSLSTTQQIDDILMSMGRMKKPKAEDIKIEKKADELINNDYAANALNSIQEAPAKHKPKKVFEEIEKPENAAEPDFAEDIQEEAPEIIKPEADITIAPTDENKPQIKRIRAIDIHTRPAEENKIDSIVDDISAEDPFAEEKRRKRALTRTGVIRKANSLIEDNSGKRVFAPERHGIIKRTEKIVGDNEDIQTKAFNQYIKAKEEKNLDTDIVKTTNVSIPDELKSNKTKLTKLSIPANEPAENKTIAAPSKEKRILASVHHTGNIEGQTVLEGFEEEEIEDISEEDIERELDKNRKKAVESFRLEDNYSNPNASEVLESYSDIEESYNPPKETPVIDEIVDYNSAGDKRAVYIELRELRKKFRRRVLITGILEAAFIIVSIIGAAFNDFGMGSINEKAFIITNLTILFLMSVICIPAIIKGIMALLALKPGGDSMMALAVVLTFVQGILALTIGEQSSIAIHLYAPVAGLLIFINSLGKDSMMARIQKTFRTVSNNKNKFSCAVIAKPEEAEEISKGVDLPYPDIRYNVPTEFATRFLVNSYASDPADYIAKRTAYIAAGGSLLIALIVYFITFDIMNAISVLTAGILVTSPMANILCFNKALEKADAELAKERGAICGFDAIEDAANARAIVLTENDLFGKEGCCSLGGIKLAKSFSLEDAMIYTASMLSETDCAIRRIFEKSVENIEAYIPKTSDVKYEERLGISGWIYDRKILLGNAKMMDAHGISIPSAVASPSLAANQRVMFLAIDGIISAVYVINYEADEEIKWELQRIEAGGVAVLVNSHDSNIDNELLLSVFDMPEHSMNVISNKAVNIISQKLSKPVKNDAKLVNNGDPVTFMRQISACSMLSSQFKYLKILLYISLAIGFLIVAIFGLMTNIDAIASFHLSVFGLIWSIIVTATPLIYKSVPKR